MSGEWVPWIETKNKRTDGICRLFGLRSHCFTRTAAADGTATENDWERVGGARAEGGEDELAAACFRTVTTPKCVVRLQKTRG
jgi:hypothetical protein